MLEYVTSSMYFTAITQVLALISDSALAHVNLEVIASFAVAALFTEVLITIPTAGSVIISANDLPCAKINYILIAMLKRTVWACLPLTLAYVIYAQFSNLGASVLRIGVVFLFIGFLKIILDIPCKCLRRMLTKSDSKPYTKGLSYASIIGDSMAIASILITRNYWVYAVAALLPVVFRTTFTLHRYGKFSIHVIQSLELKEYRFNTIWRERLYVKLERFVCGIVYSFTGATAYVALTLLKSAFNIVYVFAYDLHDATYVAGNKDRLDVVRKYYVVFCITACVFTTLFVIFSELLYGVTLGGLLLLVALFIGVNIVTFTYLYSLSLTKLFGVFEIGEKSSLLGCFIAPIAALVSTRYLAQYSVLVALLAQYTILSVFLIVNMNKYLKQRVNLTGGM